MDKEIINKAETKLLIFGVFILGLIIRIFFLFNHRDMWHDTAFTYLYSIKDIGYIIASNDVHPPLYYLIMKPLIYLSSNEIFLRSTSIVFYIFFFYTVLQILNKFYKFNSYDVYTKLITLCLISFSPTMIYYSLEIRNYMLGMFFVASQVYFFLKMKHYYYKSDEIYFTIYTILMLYTHYYTAFALFVEALYILILSIKKPFFFPDNFMKFAKVYFISFIASIPLIIYFFNTLPKMQSMWFKDIDLISLLSTFTYQFFVFPEMLNSIILLILISIFFYLINIYWKRKEHLFFLSLFSVPVILLWLISQITPVYHHRFFLFYAFALYIVIARGLAKGLIHKHKFYISIILIGVLISSLLFGVATYNDNEEKELYESQKFIKHLFSYLEKNTLMNKEYVFIHESPFSQSPYKYYFREYNLEHYLLTNLSKKERFTAGGSVIEYYEIINKKDLDKFKDKIFIQSKENYKYQENDIIIYDNGGLFIYDRK